MMVHATLDQLSSYVDAELDAGERRDVERHLEACDACRERVAGLRRVVGRLRRLEHQAPPAELGYVVERQAAARAGRGGLGARLEEGVRTLLLQPSLMPIFALVVALVIILYLFSFGVARHQSGATRLVRVIQSGDTAAPETRLVEGRTFERTGELWIEAGLDPAAEPDRVVDLRRLTLAERLARHADLEPFAELVPRVRLLWGGEVVEVVTGG